jgi:hypothetical protein
MRKRFIHLMLGALLIGGLAACDEDSSILDPGTNPQVTELDLMVDEDLTDAVIMDAEAALDATLGPAAVSGFEVTEPPVLFAQPPDPELVAAARTKLREECRPLFRQAREAWRNGDAERAAELAYQGRLCVAEVLVMVFGEEAYDNLWQRLKQTVSWLEEQVDEDVSPLLSRIRELMDEAEAIRNEDTASEEKLILATERLILALQIGNRERFQQRRQEKEQHARLAVFMARSAIGLAAQVAGDDITERQVHELRHSQHMAMRAVEAIELGRYPLAFHLAREAVNIALVVVILEPGVTDANLVEVMVQLSATAILAADEALAGVDRQMFPARLLEQAKLLKGKADLVAQTRPRVAVYLYWHAAVTAYAVIQMVSGA